MNSTNNGSIAALYDNKAEAVAIGWLLNQPEKAAEHLTEFPGKFLYTEQHKLLHRRIAEIVDDGRLPDVLAVCSLLADRGELEAAGGRVRVSTLADDCMRYAFAEALALLKAKFAARRLHTIGETITRGALNGVVNRPEYIARTRALLDEAWQDVEPVRANALPPISDCAGLATTAEPEPQLLINGLAHRATKICLGGGSKSFKTWTLLDLGLSVATGTPFWGLETHQGKVLFVNLEIHRAFFERRVLALLDAKQITLAPGQFEHWCLRGRAVDFDQLEGEFIKRLRNGDYSLLILDPAYKLLGQRDENKAGDIASLLNGFERLSVSTGAAVAFGSHFSKGNQAAKESIDRISGSGVFARDPDSILTMTRHETENCFAVEPILRNLPQMPPFVVRWEYPLMRREDDLDPTKLKQPGGRSKEYDPLKLLAAIKHTSAAKPVSISQWAELADIPRRTLAGYLPPMRQNGWIQTAGEGSTAKQFITKTGAKVLA